MASHPPGDQAFGGLTPAELDALVRGATWYATYHQRDVPSEHEDRSAAAAARREHFEQLFSALGKLGVRVRRPTAVNGSPRGTGAGSALRGGGRGAREGSG